MCFTSLNLSYLVIKLLEMFTKAQINILYFNMFMVPIYCIGHLGLGSFIHMVTK